MSERTEQGEQGEDRSVILQASGVGEAPLQRWREAPAGLPAALLFAIRTGPACVLDSFDSEHPSRTGEGAVLAAPMRIEERVIGALAFGFPKRRVGVDELALAENLATACALAMDRARLFEAERAARTRADHATEAQKELLAVVSHDLRNPLGLILMVAEQLAHEVPEASQHHLSLIRRAGLRMSVLISDLLDAASLDAGAFQVIRAEDVGVDALVDEAMELARPEAAQRSITMQKQVSADAQLHCDRQRVQQVLGNLIGNALKFTPQGGNVTVCAIVGADEAELSVADTGPGIPLEQLARVFGRYVRSPGELRRGSGLGLYIAKGIVEAHGGRIRAESRPGVGSTFRFTLPRCT